MGKLKREGRLVLSTRKHNVIVDAAATGLAMQGKAYTEEKNQKCWFLLVIWMKGVRLVQTSMQSWL
jgi:hypothetical protein